MKYEDLKSKEFGKKLSQEETISKSIYDVLNCMVDENSIERSLIGSRIKEIREHHGFYGSLGDSGFSKLEDFTIEASFSMVGDWGELYSQTGMKTDDDETIFIFLLDYKGIKLEFSTFLNGLYNSVTGLRSSVYKQERVFYQDAFELKILSSVFKSKCALTDTFKVGEKTNDLKGYLANVFGVYIENILEATLLNGVKVVPHALSMPLNSFLLTSLLKSKDIILLRKFFISNIESSKVQDNYFNRHNYGIHIKDLSETSIINNTVIFEFSLVGMHDATLMSQAYRAVVVNGVPKVDVIGNNVFDIINYSIFPTSTGFKRNGDQIRVELLDKHKLKDTFNTIKDIFKERGYDDIASALELKEFIEGV